MPRYFIEVSYKGTRYSGFQSQKNANSIQAEVEKAFAVLQREAVGMTGSSRTDTGVHALQNFLHFDYEGKLHPQFAYKINAILPADIVVKSIREMGAEDHCRFDALSREYRYFIYRRKDPFLEDRAFFFPYKLNMAAMQEAARVIMEYNDFTSFSRKRTQVKTFVCRIEESSWEMEGDQLVYKVIADRFLRGMVRALTATMLKLGRGRIDLQQLRGIIESRDCREASFAVPGHGLFLMAVNYGKGYLGNPA